MTCYHIPDEKTPKILSLHFIPTLQSAVYILYLVYILYPVCSLQSAFCTKRYPWHQYSLFLVTVIRTTHTIYHKIPVCELIRHFVLFRVNAILSFCKNVDINYNVSSNPPAPKKITLACIECLGLVGVPEIISWLRGNQMVKMEDSYLGMLHNDLYSEYNYYGSQV